MLSMRHAPALFSALALCVLLALAWPFTVDDAFISARYAERIASGLGYSFSTGRATDGVTGPLWLLPLALGARVGVPAIALAKLLSSATSVVAACWLVLRARERGWSVALIVTSSLPLAAWSVAGLETGLATLLVTWLAVATLDQRGAQAGLALAGLAWLRPELAFFAAVLLAGSYARAPTQCVRSLSIGVIACVALLAFRYAMFSHLLPMSAYAKPAMLSHGWSYVISALTPRTGLLALALLFACWRGSRWLAFAVLAHGVAVLLAGGDWMPARRLFVPVVPVLAYAIAPRARWFAIAIAALGGYEIASELPALRAAGQSREQARAALVQVCEYETIALIDVGLVGALCPQARLIDLGGLTEPDVAYARGGHLDKQIDEDWLRAQRPRALLLHSRERPRVDAEQRLRWFAGYPIERRVLGFSFVQALRVRAVIEYAPHYFYVLLAEPAAAR